MVTSETERMIQVVEMRIMKLRGRDKALIDEGMREFRRELDKHDEQQSDVGKCIDELDKRMDRLDGQLTGYEDTSDRVERQNVEIGKLTAAAANLTILINILQTRVLNLECPNPGDCADLTHDKTSGV